MPDSVTSKRAQKPAASTGSNPSDSIPLDPRDGNDALCFTPGFPGATFGAGAIHAYLAADRKPPKVVAGISLGTLSAAVMQRSYADLENARSAGQTGDALEGARWKFLRKYLSVITNRPFDVIWKGIPDPADFLAELPPIKDPVPETITDHDRRKAWKADEMDARSELYLLVKLGHWLAKSPVRISTIANLLVSYVRSKERYPSSKIIRIAQATAWQLAAAISLILHLVRAPERFPVYKFQPWREWPTASFWQFHGRVAVRWLLRLWRTGWPRFLYGVVNLLSALWIVAAIAFFVSGLLALGQSGVSLQAAGRLYVNLIDYRFISLYAPVLLASLHVVLLAILSNMKDAEFCPLPSWWFHLRSFAQWILQRPLFGWPIFLLSLVFLVILQLYTTMLAVAAFKCLTRDPWYQIAFGVVASVVCLFFTTSLATWRVPMQGKFPYRAVPLLSSIIAVAFFYLSLHTEVFPALGMNLAKMDDRWNHLHNSAIIGLLGTLLGHPVIATLVLLFISIIVYARASASTARDHFIKSLLQRVKMEKHMVHDYHLKYALSSLFSDDAGSPVLTNKPFPVVLVATPLQTISSEPTLNNQLWANASARPELVSVLRATLAAPALFDPLTVEGADVKIWYKTSRKVSSLDMVDASIVRQNPLPAFFNFLRREKNIASSLESDSAAHARVHVVYSVPAHAAGNNGDDKKLDNIIDVAFLSLRLAQRRDINLEIDQTNFIARLARVENKLLKQLPDGGREAIGGDAPSKPILPIFADHIAPSNDLSFGNALAPTRDEVLRHAAAGCKATLQRLYAPQLSQLCAIGVDCHAFLNMLRTQRGSAVAGSPGLPEICQHCDKQLVASQTDGRTATFTQEEVDNWKERVDLVKAFPQLTSEKPRIVFVASGGVFRGPFHAGMVNAMLAINMKPDLIVGASVGTLVGAALAATLSAPNRQGSLQVLDALVQAFQQSDEAIAFTKTLKNAARELGIRGRNVDLAPHELRAKILAGSKSDPGFAVTGTPPVLIDALSGLLLLPHDKTKRIAAEFVAGHFTNASRLLLAGLRTETLRRLDIVDAVMGASLLEPTAGRLLGSMIGYDMNTRQPYNANPRPIAIFGTATNLKKQQPVLLGRFKFDWPSYDFVNACLASSAFPAVFAPRREDEIFPGLGDPEQIYSDGGMFDNLPISPALEILTASQRRWIKEKGVDAIDALGNRVGNPDLFITGSLDISASDDETVFDNLVSIKRRAGTLQNNVKIKAFEEVSDRVSAHLAFLHKLAVENRKCGNTLDKEYLNGLVNAVLMPVYPTDANHLNGTFQFCNSLGRKLTVVNNSMADGCFRTLKELAEAASAEESVCGQAVNALAHQGRVPVLEPVRESKWELERKSPAPGYYCPFYRIPAQDPDKFACPFSESAGSAGVFQSCVKDHEHKRQLVKIKPAPPAKAAAASVGGQGKPN